MAAYACNPSNWGKREVDPKSLLISHPSWNSELCLNETPLNMARSYKGLQLSVLASSYPHMVHTHAYIANIAHHTHVYPPMLSWTYIHTENYFFFKKASFRFNSIVRLFPAVYVLIRLADKDETGYRAGSGLYYIFQPLNIKTINFEIIM